MKTSPLRLERSFFTKVFIHANPEAAHGEVDCASTPEIAQADGKWAIVLRVQIKGLGDAKPSYQGEVEIAGYFSVDATWPVERVEQLVHANGCAVLFSAVRELVSNITARGPWPMMVLPTVSFVDSAPKPIKRRETERKSPEGNT